jgi:DNA-directed RNA polymerase
VPLNIDFRGRVYGIPHFNFAREDHVRALFLFADGERIGEDGLQWLKAHVAATAKSNSWSPEEKPDRFGFKERIAWTDANISTLRRVGEAVLRGESPTAVAWALPKDRYQFAAACAELVQALDTGPDFITRLPVTFDGTCSGLQHLCAMTRAEEGRFVNLTAQEEAQDFYSLVAVAVWKRRPDLVDDPLDRELVKQPAMSYFYGSEAGGFSDSTGRWRPHGMTRQIYDVLKDRKQPTTGAQPLAETVCGVIGDMVPRAKALRDYLKDLADMCAKEGKHLRWDTPLGLPVINCYHQPDEKRVSVYLNGKRRQVKLVVGDKDKISRRKAANAAAANFVHSIDAAHLQLVALAAGKENIELAVVHDCFGCLAPRAKRLNEIIRQQFIELHKPNNFLAAIYSSARKLLPQRSKPPLPPEVGTLEIERVLDSFHAWK